MTKAEEMASLQSNIEYLSTKIQDSFDNQTETSYHEPKAYNYDTILSNGIPERVQSLTATSEENSLEDSQKPNEQFYNLAKEQYGLSRNQNGSYILKSSGEDNLQFREEDKPLSNEQNIPLNASQTDAVPCQQEKDYNLQDTKQYNVQERQFIEDDRYKGARQEIQYKQEYQNYPNNRDARYIELSESEKRLQNEQSVPALIVSANDTITN